MRNVNFVGKKFKKIEDDELKEKRKREQALNQKRKLLKDEFNELDELEKFTTQQQEYIQSTKSNTEFQFRKELDVQAEIRQSKEKQLRDLEQQLISLASEQGNNSQYTSQFQQENAFATKSQFSAKQFSTIFSKSYYKSNTLNILSRTQMVNKQEIEDHLVLIKQEIDTTQANIENEEERTYSIKNQLDQLFKTKQKIKQALGEIEALNEAADRRFDNLQRIQFLAHEKEQSTSKQLNKIKTELSDQELMRQGILSRQEEKRGKEHKGRKDNEDTTGNILIKIDEQQIIFNQTKQQLQELLNQERKIIKKRMQSKYIIKYIQFFEKFRQLFMGENVEEDKIRQLYEEQDLHSHNEEKQFDDIIKENNPDADARSVYSMNSAAPINFENKSSISYNKQNKDQVKEQDFRDSNNLNQEDQEIERAELIKNINSFLNQYPDGLDSCVENILRVLNEMKYEQETNNEKYEILLKAKTLKTHDLLELEKSFKELQKNNPYVELMINDSIEEQRLENIQEAFDAGYVKVNTPKYSLVPVSHQGEELAKKLSLYTTVNILKMSDMTDFGPVVEEIKYNKNFFFNFFMNYGDSIVRICKIVKTIFKKILQNSPSPLMNKRCQETIKYISSIWMENEKNKEVLETLPMLPELSSMQPSNISSVQQQMNPSGSSTNTNGLNVQNSNKHKSRHSIDNIQAEQLEILHQIQIEKELKKRKKFKIIMEKFSLEEIKEMFINIFGEGYDQQAAEFFQAIKNDRLVWFFCKAENIQEFLINKHASHSYDAKQTVNELLMEFIDLEDCASQEYNNKLNELYNHFVGMMNQIKIESKEILDDLKEKNVVYYPFRSYKQNEQQVNPKIAQAVENVIKRQNEYLFSLSESNKDEIQQTSPQNSHHLHHNILNQNSNSDDLQKNELQNHKEGSRLQQIIDYIENVPSSRQREAAKKKYLIPSGYGQKTHLNHHGSGASGGQSLLSSSLIMNHTNTSNQQIQIAASISHSNRATIHLNKEILPLQFLQNPQIQQQSTQQQHQLLQQQQTMSSQFQNNGPLITQSNQINNSQNLAALQNTQSTTQITDVTSSQRIPQGGTSSILKKQARKTQDYKSLQDIQEDLFIDEIAKKQKQREKQEYIEYLIKEKEKNKKLLQIEKQKIPNAQFKVIQDLNNRLTQATDTQSKHNKTLRQFSTNQKILSKIDRLDKNYDTTATTNKLFSKIEEEKKTIYKNMVQQEQEEKQDKQSKYTIQIKQENNEDEESEENEDDVETLGKNYAKLCSQQSLTFSYLRSTNAMEQRKKANFEIIKGLESERSKNKLFQHHTNAHSSVDSQKNEYLPATTSNVREKGRSSENNRSTVRSWKTSISTAANSKRPDTQQYSSSNNLNSQFYSSQNQKFFQKYTDNNDERMPNIQEKRSHHTSQEKRKIHSSKSSQDISGKHFKFQSQLNNNNSKNQSQKNTFRALQTSDAKFNIEFKGGNYDRANFYNFPFFSHPLSVQNSTYNIPMFPMMTAPSLNLYTPTGLLVNYAKNDNISIINSPEYN
ncbi:hypothetical protein ABPG72_016054 [Tetrahymena utriculariae]